MESPLAPVFACLMVMDKLILDIKRNTRGRTKVLAKYVGDLLLIVDKKNTKMKYSFHPSIRFTNEMEMDKSIQYLDLRLRISLDRITLDWFYISILTQAEG